MIVDALAFAANGRSLNGVVVAREFTRLCQGLPVPQVSEFSWQITGRTDAGTGRMWLDVQAQGSVRLMCQRCLEPFVQTLQVDHTIGLVRNHAQLDALDALEASGEGSDTEYLVADANMDVLALIEDELILVLPYAPRHLVCPDPVDAPAVPDQKAASPFAVLDRLRKP